MTVEEIAQKLTDTFGEKILETGLECVEPFARIEPAAVVEVCRFMKDNPDLKFGSLMCLSGVDQDDETLRVVYHLDSMEKGHTFTLHTVVPKSDPAVPSVARVWRTADWHEREAYDLVGITFTGHPDFRRILLPDDWEGHPLRKDYEVQQTYRGMQVPYPGEEKADE